MFLSYARSSEEQATNAERALRDEGYTVWRDTELPAHLSYAEVIEERLKSAKAVLVLWSAEAAKSQWVRAEADAARERGTLVQSSVDGTVPPIPFNQIQCADLKGWTGENDHSGWRKLHSSIVALAGDVEEPVKAAKKKPASSICVLPFQNQSGDGVPDYFSDGLSEDITSDLAKISGLAVVPRKKAFAFKGQDVDATAVAEQLGVGYVLEGTVRRAGDRVRITTQLVDGRTGEHAWSDRFYRDFTDVFAVQDEISQTLVTALRGVLLPEIEAAEPPAKASRSKAKSVAAVEEPVEVPDASSSALHQGDNLEIAVEEPPVSLVDRSFEPDHAAETGNFDETYAAEDWDDEDSSTPRWRPRGFQGFGLAPRLIGLGIVLVLGFLLVRFVFFAEPAAPPAAPPQEKLVFTITSTVNVRSLPSRYNSRILGTLEKGATINIVPDLAGAQPDWLKIEDGPYVGGYVWRESTRPVTGDEGTTADAAAKPRPDATG